MKKLCLFFALFLGMYSLSSAQCTQLFFSEYVEGSGNNKVLEIYNPTSSAVTLTGNYQIRRYANGTLTPTNINLTGTINPQDVFVIVNPGASIPLLAIADQTSGSLTHNGNDAYDLYHIPTTTVVDVIGLIGNDPGIGWTVNGVANGTFDHTLRRKPSVQQGNTTWTGGNENEWNVYSVDYFTYLTFHVMNTCGGTLTGSGTVGNYCMNESFNFTSTTSGGNGTVNYTWEFGDGTTNLVTTQNGTYSYTNPGTYNVTVAFTDALNQVYAEVYTIQVFPAGPTACVTSSPMDGCGTDTLILTNCTSGGTGALTYLWDFDNGNTSTSSTPGVEYYTPGTYSPYMIVTDANGCDDTTSGTFTINAVDQAYFSYAQTVYCSTDTDPSPSINGTTGGTFTCNGCVIDLNTGIIDLGASTPGTYSITYSTSGNCADDSTLSITISATIADATIDPAGPFCELSVPGNLSAATPGGTWTGNGIIDGTLGTFDPSAAGPGTHTITYTIAGTCGSSDTETITVNPNADVVINTPDTIICNNFFGFFLSAQAGGTWSGINVSDNNNGNGFYSSAVVAPGLYYAVYTISGACGDKDSIAVTVGDTPTAAFASSVTGTTINFTDQSTGAATYLWAFTENGNNFNSNSQNPTYTYLDPSNPVDACLTVTSILGCENVHCETIQPNGEIEFAMNSISFYPNPVSNHYLIIAGLKSFESISVTLNNLIGQPLISKKVTIGSDTERLDLSGLPSGTYFITVENGGYSITRKITKTN